MVDDVQRNTTRGIGLGRPVAAEPDLPKKILSGSVTSAVQDAFNQNEMTKTIVASCAQIDGKETSEECRVMYQISDFSDAKLVEQFGEAIADFMVQMQKNLSEGKVPKATIVLN
ncbi:hypothetical protein L5515_010703 [Caenorhabditis briggsae]|uniref:Uncharacterized protein n=1 Tax=Caenorhabditis briggsae TaxID=6238 RepID=A0AAE9EMW0_CAEBR|nr:hypothetical protein L5515_010703 [Caenorhabditis briggsae]